MRIGGALAHAGRMQVGTAMVARAAKATPERVEREIARLRSEGRRIGWDNGMVHGTALIQQAIGGEARRIRAMIILQAVDRGERVPAVEVAEARKVLRLEESRRRRGPMPQGVDQVLPAAGPSDGIPVLERIARGVERAAAALERLADEPTVLPRATPVPPLADPVFRAHPEPHRPPAAEPWSAPAPSVAPETDSGAPQVPGGIAPRLMPRPRRPSE
jgi:hypothetical protein